MQAMGKGDVNDLLTLKSIEFRTLCLFTNPLVLGTIIAVVVFESCILFNSPKH